MGYGPVEATRQALARAGMTINDIDLVEMNEAFAAQILPSAGSRHRPVRRPAQRARRRDRHRPPYGMTGARITTTLLDSLRTTDKSIGLETMCAGGGQGMALILERHS